MRLRAGATERPKRFGRVATNMSSKALEKLWKLGIECRLLNEYTVSITGNKEILLGLNYIEELEGSRIHSNRIITSKYNTLHFPREGLLSIRLYNGVSENYKKMMGVNCLRYSDNWYVASFSLNDENARLVDYLGENEFTLRSEGVVECVYKDIHKVKSYGCHALTHETFLFFTFNGFKSFVFPKAIQSLICDDNSCTQELFYTRFTKEMLEYADSFGFCLKNFRSMIDVFG